jgi:hypothetical protein
MPTADHNFGRLDNDNGGVKQNSDFIFRTLIKFVVQFSRRVVL